MRIKGHAERARKILRRYDEQESPTDARSHMRIGSHNREVNIKHEKVDVKIRDIMGQQVKEEANEGLEEDTGDEVEEIVREASNQEVDEPLSHQTPRWSRIWGSIWR